MAVFPTTAGIFELKPRRCLGVVVVDCTAADDCLVAPEVIRLREGDERERRRLEKKRSLLFLRLQFF
jgi:hypothetical protein